MKTRSFFLTAFFCLLFAGWACAEPARWITYDPKPGPGQGKHIVLISGDEEYRSEEGLPMLGKLLSQRQGFKCTVLFALDPDGTINPDNQKSLPGAELLDSADGIIILTRFRQWPEEQLKHFVDAVNRGVPIIGLRTATHALTGDANKPFGDFGKKILGERWVNHWGRHKSEATRGVVEASAKSDPIFNGVTDLFVTTDVYEGYPPSDAKILVRGQVLSGMTPDAKPADYKKARSTDKVEQGINDPMMPIAWTREVKNDAGTVNRVLCTTMGAATDLENESLRRFLVNAVYWGLGMPVPVRADVTFVDEYKPTAYGFKGYRKGIKPEDHALGKVLPAGLAAAPPAAEATPKNRVACVGDSITEGAGAGPGQSYPAQLQRLLGDGWKVDNFGLGGRTLLKNGDHPYWKEKALPQAIESKPNFVIIMLGTNDTKPQNWKFKDEFAADYKELVEKFLALDPKPRIFICRPVPVPDPGNFGIVEAGVQEEIPIIDALAAELKVAVIDMHAAFEGKSQLLPDRVHPNTEGAGVMAAAAFSALTGKPAPAK